MMNMKGTNYIILSILFTICYGVSAQGDNNRRMTRGSKRYQFNHPPENYAPIPVAVVYEEKHDREDKQLENKPVSTTESVKPETEKIITDSVTTLKNDFKDIKATTWRPTSTQTQNEARLIKNKRIYPDKEIHVPVEVIYDSEDDIVWKGNKNKQDVSTNNRIQNQRRRQQKEYKDISSYRKSTAKMVETTKSALTTASPQVTKKQALKVNKPTTQKIDPMLMKQVTKKQPLGRTTTTTTAPKASSNKTTGKKREKDPVVPIVESDNQVYAQTGGFQYSYEGGDGTKSFQMGELKDFGDEKTGESVSGGFSYTDKDGKDFSLTYTADENGYRPVGEHLPTSPPIPPAIARALLYLATKPTDPPQEEDTTKPTKKE